MWIEINYRDKRPLYEQIAAKIEEMILKGVVEPNEALPSVRSLAQELSINPNTIQKAYSALETSGFTYSVAGRGSFAADVKDLFPKKKEEIFHELDTLSDRAEMIGIPKEDLAGHLLQGKRADKKRKPEGKQE